jgi:hypothetical protein
VPDGAETFGVSAKFHTVNSCEKIRSPGAFEALRGSLTEDCYCFSEVEKKALSLGMAPSFRPFLPEFSQEVPTGIPQTLAKRSGAKSLSFDRARHFSIFFSLSHRPL